MRCTSVRHCGLWHGDQQAGRQVCHPLLVAQVPGGAAHQEAGRAGRDLKTAICVLFYRFSDYQKLKRLLEESAKEHNAPRSQLENNLESLNGIVSYCENAIECRRSLLPQALWGDLQQGPVQGTCDNCRTPEERQDLRDKGRHPGRAERDRHRQRDGGRPTP